MVNFAKQSHFTFRKTPIWRARTRPQCMPNMSTLGDLQLPPDMFCSSSPSAIHMEKAFVRHSRDHRNPLPPRTVGPPLSLWKTMTNLFLWFQPRESLTSGETTLRLPSATYPVKYPGSCQFCAKSNFPFQGIHLTKFGSINSQGQINS